MVRRIAKGYEQSLRTNGNVGELISRKTRKFELLQRRVYDCVCHQSSLRRNINGNQVHAQAARIKSTLEKILENAVFDFKFSEGLHSNFKHRSDLKYFKSYGKSGGVDKQAIAAQFIISVQHYKHFLKRILLLLIGVN